MSNAKNRHSYFKGNQGKPEPTLYQYEAEDIAWHMVEKIISLTVSNSFKQKVEKQVYDECYTYLIDTLNTYLNSQFITIDKEDEKKRENDTFPNFEIEEKIEENTINSILNNNSLTVDLQNKYFGNYYRGENNWEIINEPNSSEYDRYSSTLINYIIPENKPQENIPVSKLEKVEEEAQLTSSNFKISRRSRNIDLKKLRLSQTGDQIIKKRNMGEIMNKFSFHDISIEEAPSEIFKDIIDLKELRLEKETELKKKEEETKQRLKALKKVEEQKKEEGQLKKQYEKKKLTIDPNGDIVFIKGYKIETLAKEFLSIKSNMKMLKTEKQEIPPAIEKAEIINTENNITTPNINKEKKRRRSSLPKLDIKDKDKEKEKETDNNNNKNVLPNLEKKTIQNSLEKKIERGPISLSGSCFDRIHLEIGVSMKENKKFKTGGKDFFIKYNKYSIETYNKKLKDTLSANKTQYNMFSNSELKKDFNFNESVTSNFNQGSQTSTMFKKSNITDMNSIKTFEMTSSLNPLIKLNGTSSLRLTMNDLDLISESEIANFKQHRKNIFKEKTKSLGNKELNEMNKFTSTLVSNDKWGSNILGNGKKLVPIKMPNKPLKKEIEREIGKYNIVTRNRGMHNIAQFSQTMRETNNIFSNIN
jgi:hypothetical protein